MPVYIDAYVNFFLNWYSYYRRRFDKCIRSGLWYTTVFVIYLWCNSILPVPEVPWSKIAEPFIQIDAQQNIALTLGHSLLHGTNQYEKFAWQNLMAEFINTKLHLGRLLFLMTILLLRTWLKGKIDCTSWLVTCAFYWIMKWIWNKQKCSHQTPQKAIYFPTPMT